MDILERIKYLLQTHPVLLFMKGTPQFPMCEFSQRLTGLLQAADAEFLAVNVLEDAEIRASLPRHSNWPTFPQLFVQGELIGGYEIAEELEAAGQLRAMLHDARPVPV